MNLQMYSIFDRVSHESVMVTFHHNNEEAKREFKTLLNHPQLKEKSQDLELYSLGNFDTHSLNLTASFVTDPIACGHSDVPTFFTGIVEPETEES